MRRELQLCGVEDCGLVVAAHGMCRRHYDRERGKGRVRADRVLMNRARNRASAALIRAHREEFEELLVEAQAEVVAENDRLLAAARKAGIEVKGLSPRLKPGPLGTEQSVEARMRSD